jgi:hypothetical protein
MHAAKVVPGDSCRCCIAGVAPIRRLHRLIQRDDSQGRPHGFVSDMRAGSTQLLLLAATSRGPAWMQEPTASPVCAVRVRGMQVCPKVEFKIFCIARLAGLLYTLLLGA